MLRFLFLTMFLSMIVLLHGEEPQKEEGKDFKPETLLVGRFTLRPPENWQWMHTEPTGRKDILTEMTFRIPDPENSERHATVLFNHYKPDREEAVPEAVAKRWKTWFADVKESPLETITIGDHKITFLEFAGGYLGTSAAAKKKKPTPNYLLYGVVIEDPTGNVISRFFGPAKLVEKHKSPFRKTIEDAVKQD